MRAIVVAGTDIGHVREGNEDSYLVEPPLFAVADGWRARGREVASVSPRDDRAAVHLGRGLANSSRANRSSSSARFSTGRWPA
jgi:hypothetical protein